MKYLLWILDSRNKKINTTTTTTTTCCFSSENSIKIKISKLWKWVAGCINYGGKVKWYLTYALGLFYLCAVVHAAPTIDLIVFSKNRPLQLYAFLESCEKYVTGIDKISVIYYAGDEYRDAYSVAQKRFPAVRLISQSLENPYDDFKPLVYSQVKCSKASYILFAVDDIVVIDFVDLQKCAKLMKKHKAYGFYLRLGHDITECYTEDLPIEQPILHCKEAGIYGWKLHAGLGDWGYPNTVDMTLYHKKDVWRAVKNLDYDSPNTFEQAWNEDLPVGPKKIGLCCACSKIVNLPLNLVQEDFLENRHVSNCDVQFLLEKFQQGLKMDILALHQFPHKAPHAEYQPTFISRGGW